MLKSALLKKTVCITTIFSFALANLPRIANAYGYRLTPESFEEMYALAQNGRVEALRSSINRGLNIDVMNSNGDTGLCVAARRHDSYTYNSFRAAGANPRHPCTQNIEDYDNFINSSRAVPVTSTPRAAYGYIGKENYSVSPKIWWWIGGAALVGGALALALGGGGGGGGGHDGNSGGDTEDYNSLGSYAGTKGTIYKSITETSAENSSFINITNSKTEEIANINFNSNILKNTDYLDVALKAQNSGNYTNTVDTVLQAGAGTIGMTATKKAQINNFGYINVDSYNASIGMVASEGSMATNYGQGIINNPSGVQSNNGISLNFSGYNDSHTLIGMYADSKSVLQNFGDIKGSAIKASSESETQNQDIGGLLDPNAGQGEEESVKESAASGTLVGMEAMIVNAGKDLNKDTINLLNESGGKIYLSAGDAGASDKDIKVSMIGMGSFLDDGFMNGSKNINRAENVVLRNSGEINISYTGNYTPSSELSLRKGTGGIVAMRADARTSAYNLNNINLNLEEYSTGSSSIDVAAGMQSIHGGNLSNSGNINIKTSAGNQRKNYGMVSVEGSGSVSGLYADLNQNLINSGNIAIQASNSFGIASFNGGNLKNSGIITLGKPETTTQYQKNIAIYGYGQTKEATLENTGTINIYSHDSIAMQNDFSGGTTIYNNGIINVFESATNSYVFGGAYSEAHNSNTINYYANSTGEAASDGEKYNPFANYTLSIGNSIISTQSRSVLDEQTVFSSSTTEKIYNDKNSVINMDGSSFVSAMSVETDESGETQGKAFNEGEINITDSLHSNATNTVGMYLAEGAINNAYITNNNIINTASRFSAAMANASEKNASMINNGDITVKDEYSLGMYSSGYSNTRNNKNITMKGDNNIAIYSTGSTGKTRIINSADGVISVGGNGSEIENSFGIYIGEEGTAYIENNGTIDLYTKEAGAAIYSKGSDVTISNKNTLNVYGDDAAGIYTIGSGKHEITNDSAGVINVGTAANPVSESYGIYNETESEISNKGTINLYNDAAQKGYAIYSINNKEVTNDGIINLNNENGTAIYAEGGKIINKQDININYDNNNALEASKNTEVFNESGATINVGNSEQSVSNSNGMVFVDSSEEESAGTLTNNGTINLYSVENGESHAVSLSGNSTFINNKNIYSFNGYSSAIFASASATVNNNGEITVKGTNVEAVRSTVASVDETTVDGLTFNNSGKITVGTSGAEGYDSYGVFAKAINSVVNDGIFIIYNNSSYAIYAESGNSITNNNSITMNGKNSTAISGGEVSLITNRGQIQIKEDGGKGISTTGSGIIRNQNLITLNNANNGYGIYATGEAEIENLSGGIITLGKSTSTASNGNGIYAPYAKSIKNNSAIHIYASGSAITGGDAITNTASLNLYQNGSKGISSNGTSVENSGVIRITQAGNNYGIYSTGTVDITNNASGEIIIGSTLSDIGNDYGIYALNANSITNYAPITTYTSGTAVTGGNNIVNNGMLTLYHSNSKGIASNGNSIENNASISLSSPIGSYGIYSTGNAEITNNSGGTISIGNNDTISSAGAYGIYAENANKISNNALINIYATNSYGIDGNASEQIINNGNINLYNKNNTGIRSNGDSTISNSKKINITVAENSYGIRAASASISTDVNSSIVIGSSTVTGNNGNYGIYSLDGTIQNNGNIYIYGGGYGIYGQSATSLVNGGNILIKNAGSVGIYTAIGSITNNGFINMTGSTATGIYSIGTGTINNSAVATINIVSGSAIYATNNTPVINSGNITVSGSGYAINNASTVTNSGNINLGSGTAVNAKNSVTNGGNIVVSGSGTAVRGSSLNNSGNIEIGSGTAVIATGSVTNTSDIIVNGSGTAVDGALSLSNTGGTVSVESGTAVSGVRDVSNGSGGIIKTSSGTAIRGASTITNSGQIIGTDYAVDGGTTLTNNTDSTISIASGVAAINGVTTVNNSGTIEVTGSATAAILGATNVNNSGVIRIYNGHGIYTSNPGTITNSGTISVSTGTGNGIYVEVPYVGSTVIITNTGNINVASGYAIYVVKNYQLNTEEVTQGDQIGTKYTDGTTVNPGAMGEDAVVYGGSCGQHCKNGEIDWGGYVSGTSSIGSSLISLSDPSLVRNIRLLNLGQISLTGDVDFGSDEAGSVASIGKNGTYEAESFSGTVMADNSLVEGGFETVYVNEDAFVGTDNGLNIVSQSYLFDASLISNENGNLNVVMTMSSFEDKVENSRIAQYLSNNYQNQKGEAIFDILKSAGNKAQFDDYLNRELGFNIIPDLTKQSLDIERTVNTELNDDLLTDLKEVNRSKVNVITYKNEVNSKHEVSGYKDKVISVYGYTDKLLNNKLRGGLSLMVTRSESDFDDDSSRYNNLFEAGIPIIFNNDVVSVLFKPKAGFSRGHYRRNAVNKAYKANTKEFYYGFDSGLRHSIDLTYFAVEPNAGFNFTGLYADDTKENKDGLKIKSNNTLSSLISLGMDIKKKFEFNDKHSLSVIAGGKYFHELGDKYTSRATISDMYGHYDIISNRFQRNFGLISLKTVYDYKKFSAAVSANVPLEQKKKTYYLLNLGYKF
ncbi:MAG: hypothetical protein IJ532_01315 [Alphaproteobacteria bacterium]|nr:hypothetical protein [Alphaproteobacteria bacterium]